MNQPIIVFHDDHEVCDAQRTAAEDRAGSLAADLIEERAQRRELAEALVRVTEERDAALAFSAELFNERNEARAEAVQFGKQWTDAAGRAVTFRDRLDAERRENERLRTIIGELGAAEAAEPPPIEITLTAEDYGRFFPERGDDGQPLSEPEGCPAHGVHPHDGKRCLDCSDCCGTARRST